MIVCYRPSHDDQDVSSSVDADGWHRASYSRWTIINSWLGTGLKHVQSIQVKASPNLDVGLNIEGIEPSNWTYYIHIFFLFILEAALSDESEIDNPLLHAKL